MKKKHHKASFVKRTTKNQNPIHKKSIFHNPTSVNPMIFASDLEELQLN